ncbi:ImuA family protein [Phenylobacterium sp.]|jgi:protein ImuA|uniref:ImuA family protein n=1 Tax=Phenylobacterium sp. TaxID=1871053 RepID=UPI0037841B81
MPGSRSGALAALKAKVAALESGGRADSESLPFGMPDIDRRLPGGGLPLGCWHEVTGAGMEAETAAAPTAVCALMAAPLAGRGTVVWVMRRDDLWVPGLAGLGFPQGRLIQVCVDDETEALGVMEEALSAAGVGAVLGEVETVSLTAGRRLQLACEKRGSTGFVIRRAPYGRRTAREPAGSAAATRWRAVSAPSETPPREFGLGAPRFQLSLERCRGGRSGSWLVEAGQAYGEGAYGEGALNEEAGNVAHPLRLVAELGDLGVAPAQSDRRAA